MPNWTAEDHRRYADMLIDDRDPNKITPVIVIYLRSDAPATQDMLRSKAQREGWRVQEVDA